ncbi:MAG: CBS domain-containing protein [Acidobacteriota bacterium]
MKDRSEKVRDVMTRNPDCLSETDGVSKAAELMVKNDCGAIPVIEDKRLVGMITDRDIVIRLVARGRNPAEATVGEAMSRGVHTVREDQLIDQVYAVMAREQVRRIPVVGGDDEIVGIVSVADVAIEDHQNGKLARAVEEISEHSSEGRPANG